MSEDQSQAASVEPSKTPFAGQKYHATREIIQPRDRELGAPLPPLPPSYRIVPDGLAAAQAPATTDELEVAYALRQPFLLPGRSMPYMDDVVRGARLLKGCKSYIEVGIFDRGNLAFLASQLADDAIIIGVDVEAEPDRDTMIRNAVKPSQQVHVVIGDSRDPNTVAQVSHLLGNDKADATFIDGGHDAFTAMHDYVNYGALLRNDGLAMFHDSLWEGSEEYKGVADALCEIDRLDPVYIIAASSPVYRFMRPLWREPVWGVVGVVPMASRLCSRWSAGPLA